MAQNFVQDGITLQAPVVTAKIYSGTPITIGTSGATTATTTSGIDGVAMNTCITTAALAALVAAGTDPQLVTDMCVYRTEGVFSFKVAAGTTFVLGETAFFAAADVTAGVVAGEQEGGRITVKNDTTATNGDVAIGTVVKLGSLKALGVDVLGTTYVQVKIVTRANNQLAVAS